MTEEEKKELEMLRQEKQRQMQQARAREALKTAGVPDSFAPLLAGTDNGDTDKRAETFCAAYQAALAEAVQKRLPDCAPVMEAAPSRRVERGVRRIR